MSHEERQRLIRRSFQTQRIPGKSWAGVLIADPAEAAHRGNSMWDESYLRYGKPDDEGQGD